MAFSIKEQKLSLLLSRRRPNAVNFTEAFQWVIENQMGLNPLWLAEWLCQGMVLRTEMSVLDLGRGEALSSMFLAKEHDVQVWATDLWILAKHGFRRIDRAGLSDGVVPINALACSLTCPQNGVLEDAQGSPRLRETLIPPLVTRFDPEATMGFEPMIRVLQDPTPAIQTLARLSPDSV